MRVLLQRVTEGSVTIRGEVAGAIGRGLVLLVGFAAGDTAEEIRYLADKCLNLRIFADEVGKMNLSLRDIGGEILVISQFTLYGDCVKGRRPSFIGAALPDLARPLYQAFVDELRRSDLRIQTGIFGEDMQVKIFNDGPVTLMLEREAAV